ncbi:MAG: TetR/AcrR family transcriptional regulator [Candidatus Neomarinimicrobiota bacterium]|nr:MAG: TetR/AcrR family transcriptional regulator [Candidatus Neomarinimicrobiota bacterium]
MTISDRKSREKEQRRQSILEAAEKLFARDGYTATSLDRVAEEIEISKGTIYLYFKNKEDLFFSLIQERFQQLVETVAEKIAAAATLEELIETAVSVAMEETKKQHYLFRITSAEQAKVKSPAHRNLRKQMLAIRQRYIEVYSRALARFLPQAEPDFIKALALTLIGTNNAVMMEWMISQSKMDLAAYKSYLTHILLEGVRHA